MHKRDYTVFSISHAGKNWTGTSERIKEEYTQHKIIQKNKLKMY